MADQPDLPTLELQRERATTTLFDDVNRARGLAAGYAVEAVEFLNTVMMDAEEDTDRRIMAAAELLAFAKVP